VCCAPADDSPSNDIVAGRDRAHDLSGALSRGPATVFFLTPASMRVALRTAGLPDRSLERS